MLGSSISDVMPLGVWVKILKPKVSTKKAWPWDRKYQNMCDVIYGWQHSYHSFHYIANCLKRLNWNKMLFSLNFPLKFCPFPIKRRIRRIPSFFIHFLCQTFVIWLANQLGPWLASSSSSYEKAFLTPNKLLRRK